MENVYGIGITNRFSQFLHSDDDEDSIKPSEDKDMKKKGAQPPAPVKNQHAGDTGGRKGIRDSNQKNNANDSNAHRVNNRGGDSERGYRSGPPRNDRERYSKPDEHREDRNNRRNNDGGREFVREGDGGERGPRRGGFGGYRGRGGPRGGLRKREFDRQSGSDKSGVKPIDKRDGAGSRNWGTYKDDIEDTTTGQPAGDEANEEKAEHGGQNAHDDGTNSEVAAPPEEEPAKQMTLEEYRALQISQSRAKPVFNVRKAGEGEDQSQWKKMILKKKEAKPEDEGEGEQEDEDEDQKHGGRQKKTIDIEFQFSDSRRGMGNGPGRGRGRGEGGRGGGMDRGGRGGGFNKGYRPRFESRDARPPRQPAPKVDDERDFPSLGKR